MSKQELLEYLLKEIEKCGFKICDIKSMPLLAVVNVDARVMIYNSDEATPFEVAHELIHIKITIVENILMQSIHKKLEQTTKRFFCFGKYLKPMGEAMNISMCL